MKTILTIIIATIAGAFLFTLGMNYQASRAPIEPLKKVVLQNREDVYNVYMLKNCLIELQTLKGKEK